MLKKELAQIALAGLMLAGCARADKPQNRDATPINTSNAPRYIPAEQLPIRQEQPGFIIYRGSPSAEHLQYIQRVCGRIQISQQASDVMIGTEALDCEVKTRSQRSN